MPSFEDFLNELSYSNKSYPIYLHESCQQKIDPSNLEKRRQSGSNVSIQNHPVINKTFLLLQRVYKAVLNGSYYQSLKLKELNPMPEDLSRLVSSCEKSSYTISISHLYDYLHPSWDNINTFATNLIEKTIELSGEAFETIDLKFMRLLKKYFVKIPNSNYFILIDDKEKCLLNIDDLTDSLSRCINGREVTVNAYSLQYRTFFAKERSQHKNLESLTSPIRPIENSLLKTVAEKARSLYGEITLDLLARKLPIDEKILNSAIEQLECVHGTRKFEYMVESVLKEQDISV